MTEPLDNIKVGDMDQGENTITVAIYKEFVTATVSLTWEECADAIYAGGVDEERRVLNRLLRKIFNEKKENLLMFSSVIECGMWLDSVEFEVPDLATGAYSKTAIFLLDRNNYEQSLEDTIRYIKERYDHFLNPRANEESIAKKILGKYFKNKLY